MDSQTKLEQDLKILSKNNSIFRSDFLLLPEGPIPMAEGVDNVQAVLGVGAVAQEEEPHFAQEVQLLQWKRAQIAEKVRFPCN